MKTLPPVALGTWSWGTGFAGGDTVFGNHLSDTQMAEVFTAAMSKGLNLWDTAAVYGMGSSETALGALVRQFPRENIILSTKFTPQIADKQSAQPVSDMLEASLGRLGDMKIICLEEHYLDSELGRACMPVALEQAPFLGDWGKTVADGHNPDRLPAFPL